MGETSKFLNFDKYDKNFKNPSVIVGLILININLNFQLCFRSWSTHFSILQNFLIPDNICRQSLFLTYFIKLSYYESNPSNLNNIHKRNLI